MAESNAQRPAPFSQVPSSNETVYPDQDWPTVLSNVDFHEALLAYGRRKCFLLSVFLLCTSPGILNGFHMSVYVFYAHTPKHWCSVPILEDANWTSQQIRSVSSPNPDGWSNCEYYDVDYNRLRLMGYEKALEQVRGERRPSTVSCEGHLKFEMAYLGSSFVPEWNLACGRIALKPTMQTAVSVGKIVGAFTFGTLADRCGRKVSFVVASFIYIIAGPIAAVTSFYQVMLVARICLGIAALGVFESAYSIVAEICPPELRPTLSILYNHSYPLGIVGVSVIAYYVRDWRKLQLYISLPALLLVFHVWLIPESPRWLYYSGRKKRAWMVVGKFLPNRERVAMVEDIRNTSPVKPRWTTRVRTTLNEYVIYMKNKEFRRRLFICWCVWCSIALSYYAFAINAEYLHIDPYVYVALSGIVESISYNIAVPLIKIFGRRFSAATLLTIAGTSVLALLFIPSNMMAWTMATALVGRMCVSSVFCVVIVHATELFPTVMRSTAIGSSSTFAHMGSTFAPFLVDFFVIYGWWVPCTICGVTLLVAALLAQSLPETRDLALYNTLQDLVIRCQTNPKERVSFGNCLLCYICGKCLRKDLRNDVEES